MRTAQTFAVFFALLVIASGANAAVVFNVSYVSEDADFAQEVDVSVTLTDVIGMDILAFQMDWLLNAANVPASAVELPTGGVPSGPVVLTSGPCTNPANQFMCSFTGGSPVGSASSNDVGDNWLWDICCGVLADGTYYLGRFTFAGTAFGTVSIGQCEIVNSSLELVPCSSNSVGFYPIPEPTTAALLGLGLLGLAGCRRARA
jgi:hypothetical protein